MIYLISDSELRVLCSASGLVPNVRSPLVEFLAEKTQIEGRMLDENRRGLVELGLFERTETNDEMILSIILDTFFSNDFKQQCLHIHSIVFS